MWPTKGHNAIQALACSRSDGRHAPGWPPELRKARHGTRPCSARRPAARLRTAHSSSSSGSAPRPAAAEPGGDVQSESCNRTVAPPVRFPASAAQTEPGVAPAVHSLPQQVHSTGVSPPARGGERPGAQHAIGRAVEARLRAGRAGHRIRGPGQVVGHRPGAAQHRVPVCPAVHGHLVARPGDLRREPGGARRHRAEHEERGVHLPLGQDLKEGWGPGRVRAVVKGERHMIGPALPGQPGEEPPPHRAKRGHTRAGVADGQAAERQRRRGEQGRPGRRPRALAVGEHLSHLPHSLWPAVLSRGATRLGRTPAAPSLSWNDGKVGTIPEARLVTRRGAAGPGITEQGAIRWECQQHVLCSPPRTGRR